MKKAILSLLFLTIFGVGFLAGVNSSKTSVVNNTSILGKNTAKEKDSEEKTTSQEHVYNDEDKEEPDEDKEESDEDVKNSYEVEMNENTDYDNEEESFKENLISKKNEFLDALNRLEMELEDSLKDKYDSGVTSDMIEAASTECEKWDDMLNDIYKYLTKNLNEKDMDNLKSEQSDWIKLRDKKAKESNDEFEGGSFAAVNELSSLKETTKERCYELVNIYFN